jgi:hypothetical protein
MALIAFVIAVLLVCLLAARYGADSRHVEHHSHRPNL